MVENDRLFMQYSQDYLMKPMVKVFFGLSCLLFFLGFFFHFCLYRSLSIFCLLTFYGFSTTIPQMGEKYFLGIRFQVC